MSKEEADSLNFYDTQLFKQDIQIDDNSQSREENNHTPLSKTEKHPFGAELVATKISKKGKVIRILKIKKKKQKLRNRDSVDDINS